MAYMWLIIMICSVPSLVIGILMTSAYFKKVENNERIGVGFKVCALLFVDMIAGILMLCDDKH